MKPKYKYMEHYKGHDIFIYKYGRDWWWTTVACLTLKISNFTSTASYNSLDAALNAAKKYVNKRMVV